MRFKRLCSSIFLVTVFSLEAATAQSVPPQDTSPPAPQAQTLAQKPGTVIISLEDAIQMALEHNHSLLAARTVIQQNEAEETTANLRPNPILMGDSQFLPIFQPNQFSGLSRQYGPVRPRRQLPVRAGQEAAAPLAGSQRPDGRHPVAGYRQRAQSYFSGFFAVH